MEITSSFGYWVRRQRKALDLTQQALAERVGCSLAAIKKIEGDERRPSRQIAERLADSLGVPTGQREIFLETARGLRSVDQLLLAREPASPSLPSGTVTFLFTDIEGSTLLSQIQPEAMKPALARHHIILRTAIESNSGRVFQIVGDSFSAAFDNALNALNAALDGQRRLRDEPWGEIKPIYVRMGLHTGVVKITEGSMEMPYSGYSTIAFTQRIMSAAYGRQILLSQVTRELLEGLLPPDVTLRDMGEHRLKDLLHPIHLYQVTTSDLPAEFPALKTLNAFPNNLPVQLTSFVGREHELSEIKQLLTTTHLLTLTGPGGTGKTRLSLQLATEVLESFSNGVWLVELAPLADPTLVAQTIAATLGVREQPGRTILDALMDYVRAKSILLILDNCEHLIEACAQLANTLLRAAPRLKILATSREPLGIAGETSYRVRSLPLPDPRQLHDIEALAQNDCVHLFIDRAMAAYPSFRLKEKNSLAIADICRRLDGIPLAIELASARTKVFPPEEIAARLDDRFRLLTGGSRTALERHQTLFALIEWSHNLLSEAERALLRRLSVFAGGWSFQAAQVVCGDGLDDEVLDLLTHLVDKSLVAVEEETEEARYRLPETIRQYARDKLYELGEAEQVRDRHLEYFLHFAETAEPKLRSAEQIEWLERVEIEHDNLRTALAWSLESGKSDRALELAGALVYFWMLRGDFSEGQKWISDALTLSEREQSKKAAAGETYTPTRAEMARRAKALYGAAWFQIGTLDVKRGRTLVEESLRLWRELGDKWWMAATSDPAALILGMEGDFKTSLAYLEEGVSLAREIEDPWPLAVCLIRWGDHLKGMDDLTTARRFLEEGVAMARRIGDKNILSDGLRELGNVYFGKGDLTMAASLTEEALAHARAIGSLMYVFLPVLQLAIISCLQNNPEKAKRYCFELWTLAKETGVPFAAVFVLLAFGLAASFGDEPGKGARLLAATDTLFRQRDIKWFSSGSGDPMLIVFRQAQEKARAQMGPTAFQAAWAEGQQMSLEQAVALATENESEDSPLPPATANAGSA
jgi:predicted ATPase/class 3 adenylate cyclase